MYERRIFENSEDLTATSRTWANAQAFASMNNNHLAQYEVNAVVTGINFEGKHVVLVQVSANLNRLFPSVVPEVLVTENGFSRFKHLHAEIMIYFDFDINQA